MFLIFMLMLMLLGRFIVSRFVLMLLLKSVVLRFTNKFTPLSGLFFVHHFIIPILAATYFHQQTPSIASSF